MSYYLYEDARGEGYIRLHRASCGHCRRGVERQAHSLTRNPYTYWHGPYETYEHTLHEAGRLGLVVARCQGCLPPGVPP